MLGSMRRVAVAGLALAMVGACGSPAEESGDQGEELVVRTDAGPVRGVADGSVREFLGVPYAQPPVGDLRWAAPRQAKPWQGVRDAKEFGPACAQNGELPLAEDSYAEDCLYLNITTPRRGKGSGRTPVMVWVHGGGFNTGAGAQYDPARLADQGDVVVVTINYRLGVFGFFGHPALGRDGANLGLQDQVRALRWVQRNAAAFGGDPGNVTVFGESAGAFNTCALVTSPETVGLIDKAIIQSGSCSVHWPKNALLPGFTRLSPYAPREEIESVGAAAAAQLGCDKEPDVLACLRKTDAKTLVEGPLNGQFTRLAYNSSILPENPVTVAQQGRSHRVPMMVGNTRDEMRLFAAQFIAGGLTMDDAYYQYVLGDTFGADAAPQLKGAYPVGNEGKYAAALAWSAVMTDAGWTCPSIADAGAFNGSGRPPAYSFVFNDRNAPTIGDEDEFPHPPDFPVGAVHGAELPSLFGEPTFTPEQQELSRQMIQYWSRFARTGDPNGDGLPKWNPNQDGKTALGLAPGAGGVSPVNVNETHHCDLWQPLFDK